mmetsp:Transcript_37695/g.82801  ORF Transcript_37695/g.82801 Transcript_37695/m.82801 type:complete len:313 (-) Transcript_37695:138-1076(-)
MVYPTPGFIVRQTFLEFEPDGRTTAHTARGRSLSDSRLACAAKAPSQYGSDELREYVERRGRDRDRASTNEGLQHTVSNMMLSACMTAHENSSGRLTPRYSPEVVPELSGVRSPSRTPSPMAWRGQGEAVNFLPARFQQCDCTTVLLQSLPKAYERSQLKRTLDAEGFEGRYDFLFLPMDLWTGTNNAFAFVNMVTHADARRLLLHFDGFSRWRFQTSGSRLPCVARWNEFCQGRAELIERYRNSPIMHEAVPEASKPMLLENGLPVPFPEPTRRLRMPRIRGKTARTQCVAGSHVISSERCTRGLPESVSP